MARPGLMIHRKFRRLVHLLQEPVPHVLGYLECMWEVGYACGDPLLGDATDVELAAQYPGEPGKLFQAMKEAGFIDEIDGAFHIHDLFDHAPEYVAARAMREAERRKEKSCGNCGTSYHSTEPHSRHCSPACRQAAYRSRAKGEGVTDGDGALRNGDARVTESDVTTTESDAPPAPAPAPTPQGELGGDAEFLRTWNEWCRYRSEKKKSLTPTEATAHLNQLAALGPAQATACLKTAMARGWNAPAKPDKTGTDTTTPPAETEEQCKQRVLAERAARRRKYGQAAPAEAAAPPEANGAEGGAG